MQRYNPPQSSNQMYCPGCNRQIRKVQELMDERYLTNICNEVEKNTMRLQIQDLERQVQMRRCENRKMKTIQEVEKEGSTESQDSIHDHPMVKVLMEINDQLMIEMRKKVEAPEEYPLEEWKDAIEQKWSEKYEKLRDYALDQQDMVKYMEENDDRQKESIEKYKRKIGSMKKVIEKMEFEMALLQSELEMKDSSCVEKSVNSEEKQENKENLSGVLDNKFIFQN
ncbi:uncharacterized protein CELE_K04G2.10 [Caenorhabditis elegans]|uniref:Uncharacterized protein n=1 Tax=Caenorhabditis elegans TaxID=6239 RepID=Q21229_CAEEL|nr:Uncharacterized protein CELE_K04G2.10 [Caenorhabditis elegans]CAB00047.2 Uncharacterized protein CELE_K04G2.10 [Caenorhabditis elegans]|eukprot:NP_492220.2 Uncharacterized protein CELE_K04G2.10 [Caenorhabditis elegans]